MIAYESIRIFLMVFLGLLLVYCVYAIMNPKKVVKFTLERMMGTAEFYGCKMSVKATKKTADILKRGHMAVLFIIVLYLIVLFFARM